MQPHALNHQTATLHPLLSYLRMSELDKNYKQVSKEKELVEKKMQRIERAKETETTDLKAKLEAASADLRQQLKVRRALLANISMCALLLQGLSCRPARPEAAGCTLHSACMLSSAAIALRLSAPACSLILSVV